jgi:cytosine/adenosine deaminase-related metal-dependent hydrolase
MFTEMRTAALLQKALRGPEALPAERALRLATIDGARALGLDHEIGSLEAGKRADISILNLDRPHLTPRPADLVSAIVYAAETSDVETVIIDGELVMLDRKLLTMNEQHVMMEACRESDLLQERAGAH